MPGRERPVWEERGPTDLIVLLVLCLVAPFLSRLLCRWLGLVKPNFRGERIPSALGLTFVLIALGLLPRTWPLVVFGLLGFIDDRWGSRAVGGFRGHLKALLTGKPTTGSLKLVGGGLAALGVGWQASQGHLPETVLAGALVALSANTINLLDLRPGRALFGFALLLAPSVRAAVSFWPVLCGVLIEWPFDARAKGMLGDTGSNLLGALAGIAAVTALPLWGQGVMLSVLLLLNALAERYSITATIEKTPWLRWIDRRLGVR